MEPKRLFDLFAALGGLLMGSPLLALAAAILRFQGPGPVFSSEEKMGRGFARFHLYRFRGARGKPPEGAPLAWKGDERRGRTARRAAAWEKICGLPQLWNVLRGDMSLFGPRPRSEEETQKNPEDYREILKTRPGMIDLIALAQGECRGRGEHLRSPGEKQPPFPQPVEIRFAKEYAGKSSLRYDFRLILGAILEKGYPARKIEEMTPGLAFLRMPAVLGIQIGIFILSYYLAFYIRFEGKIPERHFYQTFLYSLPMMLSIRVLFLGLFSLDKGVWKYASLRDLVNITSAVTLGSFLFWGILAHILGKAHPLSVLVIDWFLNIFLLGGIRMLCRLYPKELKIRLGKRRTLIIGAGDAADLLIRDMKHSPFYPHEIIGLIDDNPKKKGLKIRDIRVLGGRKELKTILEKVKPEAFIIAIPSASREQFQEIVKDLRQYRLPILALPSFWSILHGKGNLGSLNVINVEDILFRPPVSETLMGLNELLQDKTVLVTGAGGSIGSELCRQILSFKPGRLLLLERHEESLFKVERELGAKNGRAHSVVPVIGDILNRRRMKGVFEKHRPQIVFHAAAYKHVPLMEGNPDEAFRTNVVGTRFLAEIAGEYGVERFILISTDKAVRPNSVMGMTKKIAEEVVRRVGRDLPALPRGTRYVTVRFGNVLGSSGSVVPIFTEQIKKGGPVTVTHPEMLRYFMTIPEAVNLVLQAATMGESGDIFVLDMGSPIKILDLAKRMIELHGYRPGVDIEILFTGLRPGEKLKEQLFNPYEKVERTPHHKILKAVSNGNSRAEMMKVLKGLAELSNEEIAEGMKQLSPLFQISPPLPPGKGPFPEENPSARPAPLLVS